ncbi:unnamed protein product [Tilletia controversa]|uniref:Multifunctional methyltransferase subunit TRM112 n=3 Tax=Tilletia TaxID=13289 RepID=A0A8X7MZZ2_9BASI|nr:hypothetical protein CF336_g160 [Tilletia laevis]KAE8203671.1 hypothetical protein CF328_g1514 [Tilletia controversa]KAE8264823.1 hypothetical protein A4X03_0g665 [Tilletia caries]KAE8253741.1 hypothetical protein A4X06_0g1239 [Tilletia controversa]CAD6891588.1 unnamed protein product [Tilletia caries]
MSCDHVTAKLDGNLNFSGLELISKVELVISVTDTLPIMRLLTHNLLACHAKACASTSNNFPLQLENVQLEVAEVEIEEDFLRGLLPKVHWQALVSTARVLGDASLPESEPDVNDPMLDADLLKALHHVLLEIHVMEGQMRCPNCSRIFQIRNGIPNMLLAEHELPR